MHYVFFGLARRALPALPFLLAACSGTSLTPTSPPATQSSLPAAQASLPLPGHSVKNGYYGCPQFVGGNYYTNNIAKASVDPNSASYINGTIAAGDSSGFYASTGIEQVNLANNQTPLLTVQQKVKWHTFGVKYPWQSNFYIEPLGDHHAMVVQTQTCHDYEAYDTTYSGGVLSAYSGANWTLGGPFVPLQKGNPSSMASGLSLFAGMVKWEDYQSGSINHALNWCGIAHTVSQYGFVVPASDTDQLPYYGSGSYQMPYGARLRLKASFSTAGWGPQATMVANAMKNYGVYLSDTGSSSNGIYFANSSSGSNPWNSSDLRSLGKITLSNFDVLTLPPVQKV